MILLGLRNLRKKISLVNIFLNLVFWILSMICEIPYFFCMGFLIVVFDKSPSNPFNNIFFLELAYLVGIVSLGCRFISLHVVGSWILKRVLLSRQAGPLIFGLADFILANLWVGLWAVLQPNGIAMELFHGNGQGGFSLNYLWFVSIPPIALGSLTFRFLYRKFFHELNIFNPILTRTF